MLVYTTMKNFQPSPHTTLNRLPQRGSFDRDTVNAILDEAFICHVWFAVDGQPFVIPTSYARVGDQLFIHGSAASRMLRSLSKGIPVCVTVTLVDGLVLARSAFHHSVNYRSVIILGTAKLVEDPAEKMDALRLFTEHIMKGRWNEIRWPNEQEMKGTTVLALPLEEVSAKVRVGGPVDDEEDYSLPVWAGVLPLNTTTAAAVPDTRLKQGTPVPDYISRYTRQ